MKKMKIVIGSTAMLLIMSHASPGLAQARTERIVRRCTGLRATIVSSDAVINGTNGNDVIYASSIDTLIRD